jgi:hypothetical protein
MKFVIPFNKSTASIVLMIMSAIWHGFYPAWYHMFTVAYFIRELQVMAFRNSDILSTLPVWPLSKQITGENRDYQWVKDGQKMLESK